MRTQPFTDPGSELLTLVLTRDDVDRLLRDDSADSRNAVLEKVAAHYNDGHLSSREFEIAEHIFRLLMRDLSTRVRTTLAERMQHNHTVPRDIILHLAQDVESVAMPILLHSNVLSDADLVNVVESSHDVGKLMAIANRETVSPRVTGALVETRYAPVVSTLLANEGAAINEQSYQKIVDEFANNEEILGAILEHPRMPMAVVERLISQVSAAVAKTLKAKFNVTEQKAEQDTAKMRESFMLRVLDGDVPQEEIEEVIAQMVAEGSLTPSLITTALCRGQWVFFTIALATMAKIPVENARRLLADRGFNGFTGLYRKSGLPDSMEEAVRILTRAVQDLGDDAKPGTALYANHLVERVLYEAGDSTIEYLPYFIALIRQNVHRKG